MSTLKSVPTNGTKTANAASQKLLTNGNDPKLILPRGKEPLPLIQPERRESTIPIEKSDTKKKGATIEDQLAKLEELNELAEKRQNVKEALKNVSAFYIAPNGNCNVTMQDSNNKKFSINHPFVIEEVITLVTHKLEMELDKLETMIEFKF